MRKACVEDAALLSELGVASYHHHFAHLWKNQGELQAFLQQEYAVATLQQSLQDEKSGWFIAGDPSPVGFAKISWHRAADDDGPAGALLHKLYFLPDKTGQGYGETLLTEIARVAKQRGETYLWLEVLDANPHARRFYLRQGFTHLKETVFSTASQQSTLHILGKHL